MTSPDRPIWRSCSAKTACRPSSTSGCPAGTTPAPDAPAAVVALKSRTAPAAEAVSQSLAACRWLLAKGARQIFFKYCSTFDSTEKGNIGPVAEALLDLLGGGIAVVCPAFPANARTVYRGHLFVGDQLLSESGMRHHPLTPMTDPNLVRFLGRQVRSAETVGLVPYPVVRGGPGAIREALEGLASQGRRFAVVDALTDGHLLAIGEAGADLKLITGGSGVAMGLPANFRKAGLLAPGGGLAAIPRLEGAAAVIAGSCSIATRGQVRSMAKAFPSFRVDPLALLAGEPVVERAVEWAIKAMERDRGPDLFHRRPRGGGRGAGTPRPRADRENGRGGPGRDRPTAPCSGGRRNGSSPAARPPGRWSRPWESSPCGSARRSNRGCPGRSAWRRKGSAWRSSRGISGARPSSKRRWGCSLK